MSDFKTNEYAGLLGGRWFEAQESNPMLGFRGASRYTHPAYAEGFALECAAMKRALEVMGLTNIKLMIPFCRRVDEGARSTQRRSTQRHPVMGFYRVICTGLWGVSIAAPCLLS